MPAKKTAKAPAKKAAKKAPAKADTLKDTPAGKAHPDHNPPLVVVQPPSQAALDREKELAGAAAEGVASQAETDKAAADAKAAEQAKAKADVPKAK